MSTGDDYSESKLRDRADEAIRALMESATESGEMITDWIVVAGTRNQRTLRVENQAQADLLAMRHGWRSSFTELGDGWIGAEFMRAAGEDPS